MNNSVSFETIDTDTNLLIVWQSINASVMVSYIHIVKKIKDFIGNTMAFFGTVFI